MSDAFFSLLEDINIDDIAVAIIPYQQPQKYFENEQHAYQYFQDNGGIDAYILSITEVLKSNIGIKQVVGFSASAAVIFHIMSNLSINDIQFTLFYPGQIRHFLNKYPSCTCHIIFPESESYFSVLGVMNELKKQSSIKVEKNTYQHEFMNKDSKAFEQTAYNHHSQMLNVIITTK